MCPLCMATAAIAAAKVASLGGLTAYGVKKLVDRANPKPTEIIEANPENRNETAPDRAA
jgi:hypothetical protein